MVYYYIMFKFILYFLCKIVIKIYNNIKKLLDGDWSILYEKSSYFRGANVKINTYAL